MSLQVCCALQLGTGEGSKGVETGAGDLIALAPVKQSVTKARTVDNCWAAEGTASMLLLKAGAVSGSPGSAATLPVCPDSLGAVRGCPGPAGAGEQGYCPLGGHAASQLCSPLPQDRRHGPQPHEVACLQACVTPFAVCRPAVMRHSAAKQGTDPLCHGSCSPLVCCRASAGLLADPQQVPQGGHSVVGLGNLMRFGDRTEWGPAAVVRQLAAVAKQLEAVVKQLEEVVKQLEAVLKQFEEAVKQLDEVVKQLEEVVKHFDEEKKQLDVVKHV